MTGCMLDKKDYKARLVFEKEITATSKEEAEQLAQRIGRAMNRDSANTIVDLAEVKVCPNLGLEEEER